jgi:hypothetical protein
MWSTRGICREKADDDGGSMLRKKARRRHVGALPCHASPRATVVTKLLVAATAEDGEAPELLTAPPEEGPLLRRPYPTPSPAGGGRPHLPHERDRERGVEGDKVRSSGVGPPRQPL